MTNNDFNKISEAALAQLKQKEKYIELCKNIWDYDNSKELIKSEILTILKEKELDFKISGTERLIYKDFDFHGLFSRFMISYRYGMIDSSYRFYGEKIDRPVSFSFRQIIKSVIGDFDDYQYKNPIVKNVEEFKYVLNEILKIHDNLVQIFNIEIGKYYEINKN
jgi:hypothetical protein